MNMQTYNHDRNVKIMERQRLSEDPTYDEAGEATYADTDEKCPSCEEKLDEDGNCTNVDCSDYTEPDDEDEDEDDLDDDEDDE